MRGLGTLSGRCIRGSDERSKVSGRQPYSFTAFGRSYGMLVDIVWKDCWETFFGAVGNKLGSGKIFNWHVMHSRT